MKAALVFALLASLATVQARAMNITVVGDQIIMSGKVDGTEMARVRDIIAEGRPVTTVVLRDSPGGDHYTALRLGELFRERGWRTAVSGICFSACALMYLGGRERHFTDDKPALQTQLAFHATYYVTDSLNTARGAVNPYTTYTVRTWIRAHTGGRITDAMLDRLEALAQSDFVHFFDPARLPRKGQVSIFICPVHPDGKRKCEPVPGTDAFAEGIATSAEVLRGNDRR